MHLTSFSHLNTEQLREAAVLLVEGFARDWPEAFPTFDAAWAEIQAFLEDPERITIAALDEAHVVGWVGGLPQYDGNVWELHPMVVSQQYRMRGVGRLLVAKLEELTAQRGGLTLLLGTDDETGMTTFTDADLYTDLGAKMKSIKALRRHPFEFYMRLGFAIVGVVPDANGRGKPDIIMAKRLDPGGSSQ